MTILNPVVPTQIRVSINHNRVDKESGLPLAFVTNGDDNAANRKTWKTADDWANRYRLASGYKDPTVSFLENKAISGFKIANEVRRYGWNGGNVVWRMIDPRGFEFEISSSNMAAIICQCKINAGLIEQDCYYARVSGVNLLVPLGTDLDAEVVAARTARVESLESASNNKKLRLKRWQKYVEASVYRPTRVWVGKVEQVGWDLIEDLCFYKDTWQLAGYSANKPLHRAFPAIMAKIMSGETCVGVEGVLEESLDIGSWNRNHGGFVNVVYRHGRWSERMCSDSPMIGHSFVPAPPAMDIAKVAGILIADYREDDVHNRYGGCLNKYSKSYTAKIDSAMEVLDGQALANLSGNCRLKVDGDLLTDYAYQNGVTVHPQAAYRSAFLGLRYAPVYRFIGEG